MSQIIFRAEKIKKKYIKPNLKFDFRPRIALNSLDMQIHQGDIYGFVGNNGAGKTTLIRILAGLATPNEGTIELFGEKNPEKLYRQRARINGMIEMPALYTNLTAYDNLEICRLQKGIADKKCISMALKVVGLEQDDIIGVKTGDFSLGMRQRLGIGMALLGNPRFLFFDEPLNGLDPEGIRDFRKLVQKLNQKYGITILISSHMLKELSQLATYYGFVNKGRMLEEISAKDLEDKFNRYMLVKVDSATNAEYILREAGITKLEIVSDDTLKLYERFNSSGAITKILVNKGVTVNSLTETGENLENYYMSLVGKKDDEPNCT